MKRFVEKCRSLFGVKHTDVLEKLNNFTRELRDLELKPLSLSKIEKFHNRFNDIVEDIKNGEAKWTPEQYAEADAALNQFVESFFERDFIYTAHKPDHTGLKIYLDIFIKNINSLDINALDDDAIAEYTNSFEEMGRKIKMFRSSKSRQLQEKYKYYYNQFETRKSARSNQRSLSKTKSHGSSKNLPSVDETLANSTKTSQASLQFEQVATNCNNQQNTYETSRCGSSLYPKLKNSPKETHKKSSYTDPNLPSPANIEMQHFTSTSSQFSYENEKKPLQKIKTEQRYKDVPSISNNMIKNAPPNNYVVTEFKRNEQKETGRHTIEENTDRTLGTKNNFESERSKEENNTKTIQNIINNDDKTETAQVSKQPEPQVDDDKQIKSCSTSDKTNPERKCGQKEDVKGTGDMIEEEHFWENSNETNSAIKCEQREEQNEDKKGTEDDIKEKASCPSPNKTNSDKEYEQRKEQKEDGKGTGDETKEKQFCASSNDTNSAIECEQRIVQKEDEKETENEIKEKECCPNKTNSETECQQSKEQKEDGIRQFGASSNKRKLNESKEQDKKTQRLAQDLAENKVKDNFQETSPEPMQIIDVHQYFRDDFDFNSLNNLTDLEKIEKIHEYSKTFEPIVETFQEERYSIAYFVVDEKLMRLIEYLDKIKCHSVHSTTKKKVEVIDYIKNLQSTLDKNAKDD